jgi:hypothetical protein
VHQGGGHDEKFACQVEIESLHQLQVGEVLLRDFGDRDVGDVDLVFTDEVKQQIQ